MTQEERTRISRELILEGAIREFSRHGYADASINRICTENEISNGRLFHHFQNKEDIFFAAVQLCYDGMVVYMEAYAPDPSKSLSQNFHDYFQHRQQYFTEHPYRPLLMGSPSVRRPSEFFQAKMGQVRERFEQDNLRKLQEILEHSAQSVVPMDQGLALRAFHIASYFIHLHVGYPNWDPEKDMTSVAEHSLAVFDQVVHMLLYGILPRQNGESMPENGASIYRCLSNLDAYDNLAEGLISGGAEEG